MYLRWEADFIFVVVTILGFYLLWDNFGAQSEQKWETGVKYGIRDTFVPKHTQIAVEIVVNKIRNLTKSDTANKIEVHIFRGRSRIYVFVAKWNCFNNLLFSKKIKNSAA